MAVSWQVSGLAGRSRTSDRHRLADHASRKRAASPSQQRSQCVDLHVGVQYPSSSQYVTGCF